MGRSSEAERAWSGIAAPAEAVTVISKSRFLAALSPVATVEEAAAVIALRRKEHYQARHHCTALILGPDGATQRSSDDGEPAGTAGAPMLEVLRRRRVTGLVAVVTRYFGGVLLGAGGLVRAYSGAVAAALDQARPVRFAQRAEWLIPLDPGGAGRVENALRAWLSAREGALEVRYGPEVVLAVSLPPEAGPDIRAFAAAHGARVTQGATRTVRLP